jgi:integrase
MKNQYITEMEALSKAKGTIDSFKYTFLALERATGKTAEEITKNDLIEYYKNFKGTDNSKRLSMGIIKKFYIHYKKDELVSWIKLKGIKEKRIDILTVDDINKLIESSVSPYWKAWISLAFEIGARFGEIHELKWNNISEDCTSVEILTQKTSAGLRRIPLRMSTNYLMNYKIQVNKTKNDSVFYYGECATLQYLKELAKKADLGKKIYPHLFRHSCATYLCQIGMQEAKIRYMLGWTPQSNMIAKYQHLGNDILFTDDKKEIPMIISGKNKMGEFQTKFEELSEQNNMLENLIHFQEQRNNQIQNEMKNMKEFMFKVLSKIPSEIITEVENSVKEKKIELAK